VIRRRWIVRGWQFASGSPVRHRRRQYGVLVRERPDIQKRRGRGKGYNRLEWIIS
jgi:hypothetical protein